MSLNELGCDIILFPYGQGAELIYDCEVLSCFIKEDVVYGSIVSDERLCDRFYKDGAFSADIEGWESDVKSWRGPVDVVWWI